MQDPDKTLPGADARLRDTGARSALAALADLNPEWRPWLRLLEAADDALDDPVWAAAAPEAPVPGRPPDAPLLHEATLPVAARAARRWVRRLMREAGLRAAPDAVSPAPPRSRSLDAGALLEAAVAQDAARIEVLAAAAGVEPPALAAVAQLAVRPLLQASGRRLVGRVPADWAHGYCPVCGAWPALAETRGIERARRLRCARCGGDWAFPVLRCPFCGERDHRKQGALVPDGEEDIRKIDICKSCRGYVKTVTTLLPIAAASVVVEDLAMVELDIAALQRGYARPERPGYAVVVHTGDVARRSWVRQGEVS
ncbi:MAG TPA: formate dehydrogenase accessory protein FdhE [Longimicrobiales bacterium]